MDRMITKSKSRFASVEDSARLREKLKTTRQCMEIYSRADPYLKDNISSTNNYATVDVV